MISQSQVNLRLNPTSLPSRQSDPSVVSRDPPDGYLTVCYYATASHNQSDLPSPPTTSSVSRVPRLTPPLLCSPAGRRGRRVRPPPWTPCPSEVAWRALSPRAPPDGTLTWRWMRTRPTGNAPSTPRRDDTSDPRRNSGLTSSTVRTTMGDERERKREKERGRCCNGH